MHDLAKTTPASPQLKMPQNPKFSELPCFVAGEYSPPLFILLIKTACHEQSWEATGSGSESWHQRSLTANESDRRCKVQERQKQL